ncbi:E3 ubiquitin-protein ligase rpm-1-like [Sycon ciliatum]|uniref:E3 ubiquitin-protein ligase rpm-1-like n=1 Tax=Sycon ciliatum TaxID=27933 RepID=UPI0031F60C78
MLGTQPPYCQLHLPCGHNCGGIAGEDECLPCLWSCSDTVRRTPQYNGRDLCAICCTERLFESPAIQLSCGHIFHKHCCDTLLRMRWSGPRINFKFMECVSCKNRFMEHPSLNSCTVPLKNLLETMKGKALERLQVDKEMRNAAITDPCSEYYQKPVEYALKRYAYYLCNVCKKPYYGGGEECAQQNAAPIDYNPAELVCPGCSATRGMKECSQHGTEYIGYKCRYCCSLATYYCFGTTHFCAQCHSDFSRIERMKSLPSCPVGPTAKKLEGSVCPLGMEHAPTGEEFLISCGACLGA